MNVQVLTPQNSHANPIGHMHEQPSQNRETRIFNIFREIVLKVLQNRDTRKDESAEQIFTSKKKALKHLKNASNHTTSKSQLQLAGRVVSCILVATGSYMDSEMIRKTAAEIMPEVANFFATLTQDELINLEHTLSQLEQSERSAKLQQQGDASGQEKTLMDSLASLARSEMNPEGR